MSDKKRVDSHPVDSSAGTAAAASAGAGKPPPPKQRKPSDQDEVGEEALPTPEYNDTDRAVDVFSNRFFYNNNDRLVDLAKTVRENNLANGITVGDLVEASFLEDGLQAFKNMAGKFKAGPSAVRKYYYGAPLATRQNYAAMALRDKYNCDFKTKVISVEDVDKAILPLLPIAASTSKQTDPIANRTVDMSFLEPLKIGADKFLACKRILVRDSMRRVFSLFEEDRAPPQGGSRREPDNAYSVALIGSPGVGKSILFFLAALSQAKECNIVYYRQSLGEPASVFVMTPVQADEGNGACIRIWFSRDVSTLEGLSIDLNATCVIDNRKFYEFLDGPRYEDKLVLDRNYDYLCTSGGMRPYKNEELYKRLWVLDGWSKEEAVDWLVHSEKQSIDQAEAVYDLCGGNIRDMLSDLGDVEKRFKRLLGRLDDNAVQLALVSSELRNEPENPDRLRTMFEIKSEDAKSPNGWKRLMDPFQVVDSQYLLRALREKLGTRPFLHAYNLSQQNKMSSAAGAYFESLVHRQVKDMAGDLNIKYHQSEGTGNEGLNAKNLYWVPNTQNFPLVDSALVRKNKLYVFQMTIKESKEYSADTLHGGFVASVRKNKLAFGQTVVYFVVPRGTNFRCPQDTRDVKFLTREIDTTDLTTVRTSLEGLFSDL